MKLVPQRNGRCSATGSSGTAAAVAPRASRIARIAKSEMVSANRGDNAGKHQTLNAEHQTSKLPGGHGAALGVRVRCSMFILNSTDLIAQFRSRRRVQHGAGRGAAGSHARASANPCCVSTAGRSRRRHSAISKNFPKWSAPRFCVRSSAVRPAAASCRTTRTGLTAPFFRPATNGIRSRPKRATGAFMIGCGWRLRN